MRVRASRNEARWDALDVAAARFVGGGQGSTCPRTVSPERRSDKNSVARRIATDNMSLARPFGTGST